VVLALFLEGKLTKETALANITNRTLRARVV
jgi:hypothetical protein